MKGLQVKGLPDSTIIQVMHRTDHKAWNIFQPYPSQEPLHQHSGQSTLSRFDLRFAISSPKPPRPAPSTQQFRSPPPSPSRSSFYLPRAASTVYPARSGRSPEMEELDYIRMAFPSRRKKTGEQQLLKLLLKFSGETRREEKPRIMPQKKAGRDQDGVGRDRPRLRAQTRLHWVKERYCVNRDREKGFFPESFHSHK
jgi:hypothetical protein